MKRLILAALFVASVALADDYLGTINVTDGGTANNVTTTVRDAGVQADGGTISDGGVTDFLHAGNGFDIRPGAWLTVQCRQDCHVNTDVTTCTVTQCPRLYAEQWLSIPVTKSKSLAYTRFNGSVLADGGLSSTDTSYAGGFVSVKPADGGSTCNCAVFVQPEAKK